MQAGLVIVAQVAHRRTAGACQVVERIGDVFAAIVEVGGVGLSWLARLSQRHGHGQFGHLVAGCLGAQQEVGDEAVEPEVAAIEWPPEAEAAAGGLLGQQVGDRVRDGLAQLFVTGGADQLGHVVEIEQRQGAARDLLGATIGVAIEREQQAGHVEAGDRADRQRHLRRYWP